jgi:cystathionine beta-synthase
MSAKVMSERPATGERVFDDIVAAIGLTPVVRLNRLGRDTGATLYAKLEYMNPGASIKDRIAVQMIADAEQAGQLNQGGTIIECTSGNTGMGLAMAGTVRGYRTILVMPDKVSDEKIKALRAFGARVITTPTAVAPDDPRSYYSVAQRLNREIPNSFLANQYHNPSNPEAHYRTTGPEVWDAFGDRLDAVVIATGTGGTITGIGRYLKERKPSIRMVLIDPVGSILYDYFKTREVMKSFKTYKVEGFGEDFIPSSLDIDIVDDCYQVTDKECFLTARELTRKEGLFTGGSGGGAVCGAIKFAREHPECKTILVILPDSGSRYLSKVYDDDWLRENSFLDDEETFGRLSDLMERQEQTLITARHPPHEAARHLAAAGARGGPPRRHHLRGGPGAGAPARPGDHQPADRRAGRSVVRGRPPGHAADPPRRHLRRGEGGARGRGGEGVRAGDQDRSHRPHGGPAALGPVFFSDAGPGASASARRDRPARLAGRAAAVRRARRPARRAGSRSPALPVCRCRWTRPPPEPCRRCGGGW